MCAGEYTVEVDATTLPPDFVATYDLDGLDTPHCASLALAAGEDRRDVDFGYKEVFPGFTLTKTASATDVDPNQPVTYTYVVLNTSEVTLTNVVVVDDAGTPAQPGDDFTVGTVASPTPGERGRSGPPASRPRISAWW